LRLIPTPSLCGDWEREALRIVTGDAHGKPNCKIRVSNLRQSSRRHHSFSPVERRGACRRRLPSEPKGETPPGGHWHYRIDHANNANAGI